MGRGELDGEMGIEVLWVGTERKMFQKLFISVRSGRQGELQLDFLITSHNFKLRCIVIYFFMCIVSVVFDLKGLPQSSHD